MSPPVPRAAVALFATCAALVATAFPLLAYSTSLALFGLPHVLSELRYVDARFGARFAPRFWWRLALPLALVVALRGLRLGNWVGDDVAVGGEVALVAVLVGLGVNGVVGKDAASVAGVVIAGVLGVCVVVDPLRALLLLALTHNVTPFFFIVERAPAAARIRVAALAALVFFGVPGLVASGAVTAIVVDVVDLDRALFDTGPLHDHYRVYLMPEWREQLVAAQLFSAAVTAQLLHYGAVLVWLPRALTKVEVPALPWPRGAWFVVVVVVVSAGLVAHFAVDFAGARAVYGLAAAVHAWIELPLFVAAYSKQAPGWGPVSSATITSTTPPTT